MKEMYITVTGLNHYYGSEFMEPKMEVKLIKDEDIEYDKEAIKVEMDGLGKIGYVANSPHTVLGECMSAGRIYDKMEKMATAKVKYVLPQGVVCVMDEDLM